MAKSNLFAIDVEASLRAVAEANADLFSDHLQVMAERSQIPSALTTDRDITIARGFADRVKRVAERCRRSRLDDTRPLRSFVERIEAFFKDMESEAAQTRSEVLALLTEAGRRQTRTGLSAPILVVAETGEVLGEAVPPSTLSRSIPMIWDIDAVDRRTVDLEALRPDLTDRALLLAARAHLKAKGVHRLPGASYVEVAEP